MSGGSVELAMLAEAKAKLRGEIAQRPPVRKTRIYESSSGSAAAWGLFEDRVRIREATYHDHCVVPIEIELIRPPPASPTRRRATATPPVEQADKTLRFV